MSRKQYKQVIKLAERKLKITRKDDEFDTFSIRIKRDIVSKLDDIAAKTNRSRNEIINICLKYAIDNIEFEE